MIVGVAVLALALAVRLAALPAPGFTTDVTTFMAWAERLAAAGPGAFYEPGYFADYPPGFLYVLWGLGAVFDGEALRLAVKAISIPFDLGIALLAVRLARPADGPSSGRPAGGPSSGRLAGGLWLLSPAAVIAGPFWGQVDAVGSLVLFASLAAAGRSRWTLAGALAGLAAMVKPQLGVGVILLVAVAAYALVRGNRRPLRALAAAAGVVLALGLPFRTGPLELLALVRDAAGTYPYTSLYAFNLWSLVVDFWVADDPFVVAGGLLLALGLAACCAVAVRRRGADRFLVAGALATMAFYFLPTRAHERYLFPALVLLLPVVASRRALLAPYLTLTLSFAVTLVFALTRYPGNLLGAPSWLEATLFARPGQILLALVMTGSAALLAYGTIRGTGAARRPAPATSPTPEPTLPTPELVSSPTTEPTLPTPELVSSPTPGSATPPIRSSRPSLLPAGLGPGHAPSRRDVLLALLVAVAMLLTRGYRLDWPRDMYFDEVYHARTAFELLAQREPYEWTHPHLAKEIMALAIPLFGGDRIVGTEPAPAGLTAFTAANDGTRGYGLADGTVQLRDRGGGVPRALAHLAGPPRALAIEGSRVLGATDSAVFEIDLAAGGELHTAPFAGPLASFAVVGGRPIVATPTRLLLYTTLDGDPVVVAGGAVALAAKPEGGELYALGADGVVRVLDPAAGALVRSVAAGGPARAIAYAQGPNRLFVARSDEASLDVIALEGGQRETVPLANARTGSFAAGATALAVVPRTQFLYAAADGRIVVVETHGASPFAAIEASGDRLAVDGAADTLLVAGGGGEASLVETGRHALAWRLPGVVAGALLAFFLVLLARRLFVSPALPALVGAVVLLDGSTYAMPRIAMNDVYVALFIVAGWYFVVAAHAPRRWWRADLVIAGTCFGLAFASKWAGLYPLAGLLLGCVFVTGRALYRREPGRGGPLDLLAGRGRNAALLFACFAIVPLAVYLGSYLRWFGGPTVPYGWDLVELTKQMYGYHSSLTAPHPAGSPWWSWPLVLKPVYWYYGQSAGGENAYLYDAGNLALFWSALAATAWCAVTAVRVRSLRLGFVVFALAVQYVAWVPITRVLFFYHFFTALPFYLLALAVALAVLWERRERAPVVALLGLAMFVAIFFYPFVSGLPVPASGASMFFVLPTWQYDCQFYPADGGGLRCDLSGGSVDAAALLARIALAGGLAVVAVAAGLALARVPALRARLGR